MTENPFFDILATWWTPVFVVLFILIVIYAAWPSNRTRFDAAAKIPLRED